MYRTILSAIALSLVVPVLPAAHAAPGGYKRPNFGPMPRTPNGRRAKNALWMLQRDVKKGCVPKKLRKLKPLLNKADAEIRRVPAGERGAYIDYRNRIARFVRSQLAGLPGIGKYNEIDALRKKAVAWYKANRPNTVPKTVAEVDTYFAKFNAYVKRMNEDRKKLAIITTHPCTRYTRNLMVWTGYVSPGAMRRLNETAHRKHRPSLNWLKTARRFVKNNKGASFKRRIDQGGMLKEAVHIYTEMQAEAKLEPAIMRWIELRKGDVAQAKRDFAEHAALMKQVAAVYANQIRKVSLPKRARSGSAQRIARRMVRGAVRVHATSGIRTVTNPQSEIFRARGKLWKRTWRESLYEVDIWYIARDRTKKLWVTMPGVPRSKVCSLKTAAAHKYKVALDRPRNRWLLEEDNVISPILCTAR